MAWPFLAVCVSAVHPGAPRTPCTWAPGDGAGADRGAAPWQGLRAAGQPGAERLGRRNPCRVVLGDAAGAPGARCTPWQRQRRATRRTLAVARGATGGPQAGRGARLALERGASQPGPAPMPAGPHNRPTARAASLFGRLGGGRDDAGARGPLPPNAQGPVPVALARGTRHQPREERARCGRGAGASTPPPRGGVAPWPSALGVDAGAAYAPSVRGELGPVGVRASGHVGALLGHAPRRAGTEEVRRLVLAGGRLGGR